MSTYEGEHTIFGLLGQANLTQNDVLQCSSLGQCEPWCMEMGWGWEVLPFILYSHVDLLLKEIAILWIYIDIYLPLLILMHG
jgi:hypothetical protein